MSGPRELVVISGKGGTGKTSVVAAFAALAGRAVLADCDVDAADLHLVLDPRIGPQHDFSGRQGAAIDPETCTACGDCAARCRFDAIGGEHDSYAVDPTTCEGCALCMRICPVGAVHMEPVVNGAWMLSETRFGPLVHARLGVAEDNSGKLVTLVRGEAREAAGREQISLIIVDGSPGIGCPMIASLSGADLVLAVTEPTVPGRHDLERVVQVVRQFRLPFAVLVNKADLNAALAQTIATESETAGALFVRTVDYDPSITRAQVAGTDVVSYGGPAAAALTDVWTEVRHALAAAKAGDVGGHYHDITPTPLAGERVEP